MSALFTQCLGDAVQTGTGKGDPARKFKYTTAARAHANILKMKYSLYNNRICGKSAPRYSFKEYQ